MMTARTFTNIWCPGAAKGFLLALAACLAVGGAFASEPETGLRWNAETRLFDADINNWPLERALKEFADATGWKVIYPEGIQHKVSARFQGLSAGDALRRLLGNLNFAAIPAGGGTELHIYPPGEPTTARMVNVAPRAPAPPQIFAPPGNPALGFGKQSIPVSEKKQDKQKPPAPDLDGDGRVSELEKKVTKLVKDELKNMKRDEKKLGSGPGSPTAPKRK